MLMLMRKWEQHKTNKWVRSSGYAYAYVAGDLTCLCLCYAYACAYALVRTGLKRVSVTCDRGHAASRYEHVTLTITLVRLFFVLAHKFSIKRETARSLTTQYLIHSFFSYKNIEAEIYEILRIF